MQIPGWSKVPLLFLCLSAALLPGISGSLHAKGVGPTLKIVKEDLYERNDRYLVKGSIYNPNARAVKNVSISYYIWKKWQGQEGHGWIIRDTGGLVEATIKYIPPKSSVDFVATSDNAIVMTEESGLRPDPLAAEISASWDNP
jgi:hypothetical protein